MSSKISTMPASVEYERCVQCRRSLPGRAAYCLYCGANQSNAGTSQEEAGQATGWNMSSLISLVLGLACLIAAVVTGALFSQQSYYDWQAVQAWRLEWLAAGIACFLLSLCLRGLGGSSH